MIIEADNDIRKPVLMAMDAMERHDDEVSSDSEMVVMMMDTMVRWDELEQNEYWLMR